MSISEGSERGADVRLAGGASVLKKDVEGEGDGKGSVGGGGGGRYAACGGREEG